MKIFQKCADFTIVDEIKEQGIYPYFHKLESRQDVEVIMEGKRRIMLGSNNYLGLTVHPEVMEAAAKPLKIRHRLLRFPVSERHPGHAHTAGRELAEFVGKEAACTFPSASRQTSAL